MVINGNGSEAFRTDVAINYGSDGTGRIVDIGDMQFFAAKEAIDADNKYLVPGLGTMVNMNKLDDSEISDVIEKNFQKGFTTQLLKINGSELKQFEKFGKTLDKRKTPVNIGIILDISKESNSSEDMLALLAYLKTKGTGLISEQESKKSSIGKYTQKPVLSTEESRVAQQINNINPQDIKTVTSDFYTKWKINRRGTIKRGALADLLLISNNKSNIPEIKSIFIKGHRVFQQGAKQNPDVKGESWY